MIIYDGEYYHISNNQSLFKNKLSYDLLLYIIKFFKLNENDWNYISYYQKISEKFIEKYKDKVNWIFISANQKLSEQFIERYKDYVNWYCISVNQKLSEEFKNKHRDRLK